MVDFLLEKGAKRDPRNASSFECVFEIMEFTIKVTNCVYLPILLREALEVRTRGKDIDER